MTVLNVHIVHILFTWFALKVSQVKMYKIFRFKIVAS